MNRFKNALRHLAGACCGLALVAGSFAQEPPRQGSAPRVLAGRLDPATGVRIPDTVWSPGDVTNPLPANSPPPSANPRMLEGLWVSLGRVSASERGQYLPAFQAELDRNRQAEQRGEPIIRRGVLCRPTGTVAGLGNQFPTMIQQRDDVILFINEEGRATSRVFMNGEHPANLKPTYAGHSIGHWEGNTLVVETVGFKKRPSAGSLTPTAKVTTRIVRASYEDPVNGARLVITRVTEDPATYQKSFTTYAVGRWRPDLQMAEFNCEESTPAEVAAGLKVE